jgi:hypothetical protein
MAVHYQSFVLLIILDENDGLGEDTVHWAIQIEDGVVWQKQLVELVDNDEMKIVLMVVVVEVNEKEMKFDDVFEMDNDDDDEDVLMMMMKKKVLEDLDHVYE